MAAISCGIYDGEVVIDLDYAEDSNASTDSNFVMTGNGQLIEIQGTAEKQPFTEQQFLEMMMYARKGINKLVQVQRKALKLI